MRKSIKLFLITLIIIFALVMALSFSACSNSKDKNESKSLYAHGLDVVQLMSEMTRSEEYIGLHTGSTNIHSIIQSISTYDYVSPKAVYSISIPNETLSAMAELNHMMDASDELKAFLKQRVLGSMMTQINGMSGVENLAASSICTAEKTFVHENIDANIIYIYTYDNAIPVAITFTLGEDHTVSASGVFVMYDGFTCGSADEIKSFFSDITVDIVEVLPEK